MTSSSAAGSHLAGREKWIWRAFLLLMTLAFVAWAQQFRWAPLLANWPFILKGLGTSVWLAAVSLALGFALAVPLAVLRVYGPWGLRHAAGSLIDVVRALPELMVIFWVYFGLPRLLGRPLDGTIAALIGLSVIAAAYLAEVIRAGFASVPRGQWEAGTAAGLHAGHVLGRIILPQALRNMVPAFIGQAVMLFKTSSLVYVVGVVEFFRAAEIVNSRAFSPEATYTMLAVGYFLCCSALSALIRRFDRGYGVVDQ